MSCLFLIVAAPPLNYRGFVYRYDAIIYAKALSTRIPGTHNLHLVEGADHNFTGRQDDVVNPVLEWLVVKNHGDLKSGLWETGVRGKL